ncbi:hypothetical protein [Neolewinella antarctica]|uniref:DUF2207 domain-containing protein n=1 Tax=Neolewinella antarctica TaxID=442734 RepID=A0ABX0XG14_9BACT|nr:hypothetical protein [Neolewinella antarctica]NJC27692.1 hypothetical protein [Neolewinella antarctica]
MNHPDSSIVIVTIVAIVLAAFAMILTWPKSVVYTCDDVKFDKISITGKQSSGDAAYSYTYYKGVSTYGNTSVKLSDEHFHVFFPDKYPRDNEFIVNRDTLYEAKVYFLPNGKTFLRQPEDCKEWKDDNQFKIYISFILFIPLILLTVRLFWKTIVYMRKHLFLLTLFLIIQVNIQAQEVDSTTVFLVNEVKENAVLLNYPIGNIILRQTDGYTISTSYPEGVLVKLMSASDTVLLNSLFLRGDARFMFPIPAQYVNAVNTSIQGNVGIQPQYKIEFQGSTDTTCYLKFSCVQLSDGTGQLVMMRMIKKDGRWYIDEKPIEVKLSVAISSTKKDVLHQILTGETSNEQLSRYHQAVASEGVVSLDAFVEVYLSWFNGDTKLSKEQTAEYTNQV